MMEVRRSGHGKMEELYKEKNVLGNCGPVPRNGTCVDDKYDRLCVIEMIPVLDPDSWVSGDVHGLDGVFHVW